MKSAQDHQFPPIEPGRRRVLRKQVASWIARSPRLGVLRDLLLNHGGHEVVFFWPEPHVTELHERGREFPGPGSLHVVMAMNNCHANAALLWMGSGGAVEIVSGYALSEDGLWRQHSWGLDRGRVVETTAPRNRYFGFVLTEVEARAFSRENTGLDPGDFNPAPAEGRGK
jgi:hypothetical protein